MRFFVTFGWSRERPSYKSEYQNLGSIPPVPKPQKSISKNWAAFPLLLKSVRVHVDIIFCQSSMKADPLAQQPTVQGKTRNPDLTPKT